MQHHVHSNIASSPVAALPLPLPAAALPLPAVAAHVHKFASQSIVTLSTAVKTLPLSHELYDED